MKKRNIDCVQAQALLIDAEPGSSPPSAAAEHLRICNECSDLWDGIEMIGEWAHAERAERQPSIPMGLEERLMERLAHDRGGDPARDRRLFPGLLVAGAAAVLLLALLGLSRIVWLPADVAEQKATGEVGIAGLERQMSAEWGGELPHSLAGALERRLERGSLSYLVGLPAKPTDAEALLASAFGVSPPAETVVKHELPGLPNDYRQDPVPNPISYLSVLDTSRRNNSSLPPVARFSVGRGDGGG